MIYKLTKSPKQSAYLWQQGYRFVGQLLIDPEGNVGSVDPLWGEVDESHFKPIDFRALIS